MKAVTKIMLGGAGLAALVSAAPAAAQYGYPGYGYGYGNNGAGVIGNILNQILGGRSYNVNQRNAVEQCVRAVEYRINTRGLDNEGGRYRNYGYGYGYNNAYGNGYMGARVVSVTDVRYRNNGGIRVYGLASTGGAAYQPYGDPYGGPYGNQYGNAYGYQGQADAQFNCTVDRYGRITDIDASRRYGNAYPYRRY
jgi:hypothetical protein